MKRAVRRRARAEVELLAHVEHIAEHDPTAALRFVDAVEAALTLIAEFPELGAPYESSNPRLRGLRRWVLPRFPNYVLFYQIDDEVVHLLHVFHGASDYDPSADG